MKFIILTLTLMTLFSCDRGGDFSMELKSGEKGGAYLNDKELQAQFSEEENKKVAKLCELLSKNKVENKTITFQTVSKNCKGKSVKEDITVKIESSNDHQYYSSVKPFPFYQPQTNTQGIIKDLCQQQSGQKVIAMSNHGGTVRYLFNFNKSCSNGDYCLEAGTVVKDYKTQKMKLVRKELFHINDKGVTLERELVYLCKDEKTPFHYKAVLK